MNRHLLCIAFLLLCLNATMAADAPRAPSLHPITAQTKALVKGLDPMVVGAMHGYDTIDFKLYYADFSETTRPLCSMANFYKKVVAPWRKPLGKLRRRKIWASYCLFDQKHPLLAYKARFDGGLARISVSFTKEGKGYKIVQIHIEALASTK